MHEGAHELSSMECRSHVAIALLPHGEDGDPGTRQHALWGSLYRQVASSISQLHLSRMANELASEELPTTAAVRISREFALVEYYWRDRQQWLEQCGYMLRPRYKPDWVPSWQGTKKHSYDCEDGLILQVCLELFVQVLN